MRAEALSQGAHALDGGVTHAFDGCDACGEHGIDAPSPPQRKWYALGLARTPKTDVVVAEAFVAAVAKR